MQLQDYASSYQLKSDEELRLLALDREDLIPEARLALEGELSRRKMTVERSATSASDGNGNTSETKQELIRQPLSTGSFVEEVLDLYQRHFWFFFKLTLPVVAVSWILFYATSNEVNAIFGQLFSAHRHIDLPTLFEAYSLRGSSGSPAG